MLSADKGKVKKKQRILSRAKSFLTFLLSLREKGWFCSKEQKVFFTNGPELHHYRDGGAFLHFSSRESMSCLLVSPWS